MTRALLGKSASESNPMIEVAQEHARVKPEEIIIRQLIQRVKRNSQSNNWHTFHPGRVGSEQALGNRAHP